METLRISTRTYTAGDFVPLFSGPTRIKLAGSSVKNLNQSHKRLQEIIASGKTIYGVNTGFGNLSHIHIDQEDQFTLQLNLVRSHAAGVGAPLEPGLVRATMVLKLLTYVKGFSGVRLAMAEKMIQFLNKDIIPVIPEKVLWEPAETWHPWRTWHLQLLGKGMFFTMAEK